MTKDFRFDDNEDNDNDNKDANIQEIIGAVIIIWIYILPTLLTPMKMVIINYYIIFLAKYHYFIQLCYTKTHTLGFCCHWYDYQICSSNFFCCKDWKVERAVLGWWGWFSVRSGVPRFVVWWLPLVWFPNPLAPAPLATASILSTFAFSFFLWHPRNKCQTILSVLFI